MQWDVTYKGLPLERRAYEIHLELLARIAAEDGGRVHASRVCAWLETYDRAGYYKAEAAHQAWCAIERHGLVFTYTPQRSPGDGFAWSTHLITELGRAYLAERK